MLLYFTPQNLKNMIASVKYSIGRIYLGKQYPGCFSKSKNPTCYHSMCTATHYSRNSEVGKELTVFLFKTSGLEEKQESINYISFG